jgi:hypothetical protein
VTTSASYAQLDPDQQSASQIISAQLTAWGLGSLSGKLNDLIREGLSSDAITLRLAATDEYKRRFAANETRIKNGLAALSPAEYIATENSYRQVMQTYGLPSTFYDSQDDYRKFLEADLSPSELNDRAKVAQSVWLSADDQTRSVWRDWYGLSDGAAIASILDPTRALPIVQSQAEAARAGGFARQNGLEADQARIRGYVDSGITGDQLAQGFSDIGTVHGVDQAIGRRFGADLSQTVEEASRIQGLASARRAQADAYASEQALFQAKPGADRSSLSRRTSGSY